MNTTTRRYPRTLAQAFPRDHAYPIEHYRATRIGTWGRIVTTLAGCIVIGLLIGASL